MTSKDEMLADYLDLQQEEERTITNIEELEKILEDKDKDKDIHKYAQVLGLSPKATKESILKRAKTTLRRNQKRLDECQEEMTRLSDPLMEKGVNVAEDMIQKALDDAADNKNSDWRRNCDEHLNRVNPRKRSRHGITMIEEIGASGYKSKESNDDTTQVDVLDETADTMQNDLFDGAVFNVYAEEDDIQGKGGKLFDDGSIVVSQFRLDVKIASFLKPYQKDAAKMILQQLGVNNKGFLLAHSMGLGKTLSSIACISSFQSWSTRQQQKLKVLIVAPLTVRDNWYSEFEKWDEKLSGGINIIFHHPVKTSKQVDEIRDWNRKGGVLFMSYGVFIKLHGDLDPGLMVIDEAHNMKNTNVNLYKCVKSIPTQRKLLLTGTPMQNHLMELYNIIELIQPGLFESSSTFKKEYAIPIQKGMLADASDDAVSEARKKISVINLLTEDCMDRKTANILSRSIGFPISEFKCGYKISSKRRRLSIDSSANIFTRVEMTMKAALPDKVQAAFDLISAILKDTKEAVLVFSKRRQPLLTLQSRLKCGFFMDCTVSAGETRQDLVNRFQACEERVFFMTTIVGGVGINLTAASRVIFLDPHWNPAADRQACFRAYRIGQNKQVRVYRFIAQKTIEETQYRVSVHKGLASCRIMDEEDVRRHLTMDQLKNHKAFVEKKLMKSDIDSKDKVLASVCDRFTRITDRDVLFAQDYTEKVTDEERACAQNDCNRVLARQETRSVKWPRDSKEDTSKLHLPIDSIHYPDEYGHNMLLPPMTPVYHNIEGSALFLEPILPTNYALDGYHLEMEDSKGNIRHKYFTGTFQERMMSGGLWKLEVKAGMKFPICIRVKGVQKKSDTGWSDWSAPMYR